MTNEEILANAPEGATHVHDEFFFKQDSKGFWLLSVADLWVKTTPVKPLRWIGDIRENIELKKKLDETEDARQQALIGYWERSKEWKNHFSIEQQIKALEVVRPKCHSYAHVAISDEIEQLRQQLNGGE